MVYLESCSLYFLFNCLLPYGCMSFDNYLTTILVIFCNIDQVLYDVRFFFLAKTIYGLFFFQFFS